MNKLKRITSEYIEEEDRIRLAGVTEKNETLSLWFTMRLTSKLVSHCIKLLAEHSPELERAATNDEQSRKNLQDIVQQSAEQEIIKEEAVSVTKNSPSYLIKEIDVKVSGRGIVLILKEKDTLFYELNLDNRQLRQWLRMLYLIWKKADWPLHVWPDWMNKPSSSLAEDNASIH